MPLINMTQVSVSKLQAFVADSNRCFDGRSGEKTTVAPVPNPKPPEPATVTQPAPSGSPVEVKDENRPATGADGAALLRVDDSRQPTASSDSKG
jgi:hypothetical protein